MNDNDVSCTQFREQLSASRDNASWLEPDAGAHVTNCPACHRWMMASDHACRVVRLRTPAGPSLVAGAVAAWDEFSDHRLDVGNLRGRVLLAAASVGCIAVAAVLATGDAVHSHLGNRAGRELVVLEVAIAVGLACAAWRPPRFLTGVVPMLVLVTTLNIVFSVTDLITGQTIPLVELTHIPFVVAFAGVMLCRSHVEIRASSQRPTATLRLPA